MSGMNSLPFPRSDAGDPLLTALNAHLEAPVALSKEDMDVLSVPGCFMHGPEGSVPLHVVTNLELFTKMEEIQRGVEMILGHRIPPVESTTHL